MRLLRLNVTDKVLKLLFTKYKSEIKFIVNGKVANAKSLINLMALGVKTNNKVEIQAIGSDEDQAILGVQQVMKETKLI
ncbi:MAG: HPr family phosphocarrier protein [Mycoplasmataceae bacterium]|nr:HPr family phosphocarrier protein [Mycoplasmataceae bacterium]